MKIKLTLSILLLIVSISATGQIKIIAAVANSWAKEDKTSFAGTLLNKIDLGGSLNLIYEVKPLRRAVSAFSKGKYDCFFGGSKKDFRDYIDSNLLVTSDSVLINEIRVLTLKKNKKISSIDEVISKRGSHLSGVENILTQNRELAKLKNVSKVSDISQSLKMIQFGRIDYIVHWSPLTKQLEDKLHFDKNLSLYKLEARMNCFKTKENLKFLEVFNKQLKLLNENNSIEKLYRKFLAGKR